MVNNVKNNDTEKETSRNENVKQLNAMNQSGSEVSQLFNNIKDVRQHIEGLLNKQREFERQEYDRLRKQELEKQHLEELEKAPKIAEPVIQQENAKPIVENIEKVETTAEKVSAQVVIEKPKVEAPVIKTESTAPTLSYSIDKTRTKQFSDPNAKPSYIRGMITPPPVVSQPPRDFRNNSTNNNNRTFVPRNPNQPPRPFNNTNTTSGSRPPMQNQRQPGQFGQNQFNNNSRPPQRPTTARPEQAATVLGKDIRKPFDNKKKDYTKTNDDKKSMNKRTLIRKGFIQDDLDDERMGTRKLKNRKIKEQIVFAPIKIEKAIITTENLTVKILSEKIGKTAQEIIKQLMVLGIMTTINSVVDFPTMELVASELGVSLELRLEQTKEEQLEAFHDEIDDDLQLTKRPPIITVMGHVDHGKTSLLDAIKKTSVVAGEAGGITQHIGAYSIMAKNEKITFLDTPGHEAFSEMRARGANVTDIVVLVVAADDGIMPQTIEAINHAKAANVPIIVAINKIDKPAANPEKIKQTLTEYGLVTEEWGGDTIMVPISAKTGDGIDKLLENILLLAEMNNYKANPERKAKGTIIEAKLDKGKGPVATIIVQNGTLHIGDTAVSGMTYGRIRAMVDDKGRNVKEAGPSMAVSVLGFTDVPSAGETIFIVTDEKMAKQVATERNNKLRNEQMVQGPKVTLDDVFNKISENLVKEYNIIIKADVQGSVEALKSSLIKLSNSEVKVNVVFGGVGAINKSDLMLAGASKAIVIGFNVRPDSESKIMAENTGVDIRLFRIIYEALDNVEASMKGMIAPKYKEDILGRAQVRSVFKVSNVGVIAGSYVTSGKITRNSKVRVYRENAIVYEGNIDNLKRFKDDAKEVATGYECGISVDGFSDFKENDEIEAYILQQI